MRVLVGTWRAGSAIFSRTSWRRRDSTRSGVPRRTKIRPSPQNKRDALLPLRYYPPDPSYSVAGRAASGRGAAGRVEMPTSTGTLRRIERVGVLEFTFKGQNLSLGAFVEEGTRQIDGAVRPVRRSDDRQGDVSRRALPGPPPDADRLLRRSTSTRPITRTAPTTRRTSARSRRRRTA